MLIKYFQQYRWQHLIHGLQAGNPWTFICKLQVHKNTKVGVVQLGEFLSSIQNPLHHINQVEWKEEDMSSRPSSTTH